MKIFLSSTYKDLKEIRKVAINFLRGIVGDVTDATGEVVAMEFFDATERICKDECLHELSDCNLMIGIYADKYGTLDTDGRSLTEIEFDYAVEHNIPILSFVQREVLRDEKQTKFISEKVHGQNKSCANFDNSEDFLIRLNSSLQAYLGKYDGYSINSLWDQVQSLKLDIHRTLRGDKPGCHLQMIPYSLGDEDMALETIYDSAKMLAQYTEGLYKENNAVFQYAYDIQHYPEQINDASKKQLCENVANCASQISQNWDMICLGIPNHTTSILLAISFLKLKRMQERLLFEPWSEELRQEVIRVRTEYLDIINKSYYID